MRSFILGLLLSAVILPITAKQSRAYDMDCAIMLCMAGGFPSSAVCSAAYAEMIRRITPWPIRPPFGICTFAAVPVELGGSGGDETLDVTAPEYAWLRRTRVLWFYGSADLDRGGDVLAWYWRVRACDHANSNCEWLIRTGSPNHRWTGSFVTPNGQHLRYPRQHIPSFHNVRAVLIEYGDYDGNMSHSEWFAY